MTPVSVAQRAGTGPAAVAGAPGRRRALVVTTLLALGVAVVATVALCVGEIWVPPSDVGWTLIGSGSRMTDFVILEIRLPRVLTGVLAGFALGVSGAICQSVLRNPLASPDVIGITAGASATAVTGIVVFGMSGALLSFGALGGAVATMAVIYLLAWRGGASGYRLVLIGVGVGALLVAVVSFLLTKAGVTVAQEALVWLTGSLSARTWQHALPLAVGVAVLVPAAVLLAGALRVLVLGDELAAALGLPVERIRLALLAVAVGFAAVATAAAGPVQFVALLAAPVARRLVRGSGTALGAAGLAGALMVTVADLAGQHLSSAAEIPAGVLTGLVGAPYLLWVLTSTRSGAR